MQTTDDLPGLEIGRVLLAHFEQSAAEWAHHAERARIEGSAKRWQICEHERTVALGAAERVRMRLVALSGLTEGDVAVSGPVTVTQAPTMTPQSVALADACQTPDEPPEQLAALSDWLRARLGHLFVWVTASRWQEIAWLLLASRPGGVR